MNRTRISSFLRLASYFVYLAVFIWMEIATKINACSGVGCMGNMLVAMASLAATPILAATFNFISYLLQGKPSSTVRLFELGAFLVPASVAALVVALFVVENV